MYTKPFSPTYYADSRRSQHRYLPVWGWDPELPRRTGNSDQENYIRTTEQARMCIPRSRTERQQMQPGRRWELAVRGGGWRYISKTKRYVITVVNIKQKIVIFICNKHIHDCFSVKIQYFHIIIFSCQI